MRIFDILFLFDNLVSYLTACKFFIFSVDPLKMHYWMEWFVKALCSDFSQLKVSSNRRPLTAEDVRIFYDYFFGTEKYFEKPLSSNVASVDKNLTEHPALALVKILYSGVYYVGKGACYVIGGFFSGLASPT